MIEKNTYAIKFIYKIMHIYISIEKGRGYVLIFISHYLAVEVGVKNIEFVVVCPLVLFFSFFK